MKIDVGSITHEGLICAFTYEPGSLDVNAEGVKLSSPVEAGYRINKEGSNLFVNVEVKASIINVCSRCLEDFSYPIDKKYSFHYKVKDTDIVDTTEDLRQEIILDYPLKPLCKPDCLGLCSGCGENLNKGKCNCQMRITT